nr:THAP domain-containing protein 4-like [Leptinotarsa decemlineata]
MHEILKPLKWLIGTWRPIMARVVYPTMKCPVDFDEKLCFLSAGQPVLNYTSTCWHPKVKHLMHLEGGYVRIDEHGCLVTFLTAQNLGISTVEQGVLKDKSLETVNKTISTTTLSNMQILAIERVYILNDKGQLSYTLRIQTAHTPLATHVDCLYEKEKEENEKKEKVEDEGQNS